MIAWLLALTLLPQPAARISGVVISDDGSRKPVRHALVSLSGPSNSEMITGDDGTFAFPDLVAGHYMVFAGKPGFAHTIYGTRPGRDIGTPIAVAAGQQITTLQLKLARGAVITGTLAGPSGEPVPNVTVSAWQFESGETRRRPLLAEAGSAMSDEEGVFRIFGLAEGEFVIQAQPSSTTTDVSPYAPTYYPSTARISESPRISVHAGEERSGADIVLRTSQRANVSGVVVDADGRPASGLEVTLRPTGIGMDGLAQEDDALGARTVGDGGFTFTGVLSGTYTLLATEPISAMTATSSATPRHWASMDLSVDARDVAGISLTLRPATPVSGRVVFDGTASIGATSLAFIPAAGPGGRAQPTEDGMWSTAGLIPGQYSLIATSGRPWLTVSAMLGGRDVLGTGLTVTSEPITGLTVTFSDQSGGAQGRITDAAGAPAPDYIVVVFSADRAKWQAAQTLTPVVAPDTNGDWAVSGLPPGDYRVAAITEWQRNRSVTTELLEQLMAASAPITITAGASTTINLRVGG